MKNSIISKGGIILLSLALIVGMFSTIALADNNEMNGMRGGFKGNISTSRYGMLNKGNSNQGQNQNYEDCSGNLNSGMGNRESAPDDDGDGIPNGQDSDYVQHNCDEEYDVACGSEPKGNGMGRKFSENKNDNISELSVHVSGIEMKTMSIADIAGLWGIDADKLLDGIKNEFKLSQTYNTGSTIDDLRGEYRFFPYQIMEIAEGIKVALVE